MASTSVVDAAAGATAGNPSIEGAGSPAGDSQAALGALLTDDSILGIGPDSGESTPSETPAETQPAAETTAAQSAAPQELTVDSFKSLFKDHPEVNSLWDQFSRLRDASGRLGTATQIAKVADSLDLIGGAEKLAEMVENMAEEEQAYSALAAGSPEDRKSMLDNYAEWWGPDQFAEVSRIGLDVLKARAPEEYKAIADRFFTDVFKSEGLYSHLASIQKAQADGKDISELVSDLIGWAYNKFNPGDNRGQSLEAKRIETERQRLEQDKQSWRQRAREESFGRISTSVRTGVNGEIAKLLDSLKVNGRPVFGENSSRAKAMVTQQVYDRSFEKINSNPILTARLRAMEAAGASEKDTIDLLSRAYNGVLRAVAQEVVGEWTQGYVGQQKAQLDRAKAAASRPDAGSAVSRGERTSGKIDRKQFEQAGGYKLSDDDILNL